MFLVRAPNIHGHRPRPLDKERHWGYPVAGGWASGSMERLRISKARIMSRGSTTKIVSV